MPERGFVANSRFGSLDPRPSGGRHQRYSDFVYCLNHEFPIQGNDMKKSSLPPCKTHQQKSGAKTLLGPGMNRRTFLGATAATAAVSVLGFPLPAAAEEIGPENPMTRYNNAFQRRKSGGDRAENAPISSPYERRRRTIRYKIRELLERIPHDSLGNVNLGAYSGFHQCAELGQESDFDAIQLGGTLKLSNPQSSYSYCLEGV